MPTVNGVLGPIDADDIGFTLMHEHILIANWAMRSSFADWINPDEVIESAVTKFKAAMELGVKTIVDLTPINLGRDVNIMRAVAEQSGIQIIAATGFYWQEEPWMAGWSPKQLADWLMRDIDDGIMGTDSKAGIIKCATDHQGLSSANKKVLGTAAELQKRSGLTISTHTMASAKQGLDQQKVFKDAGVDLSRVVIGHCGDSEDIGYLEEIINNGSFIGMDRFGLDQMLSTPKRINTIAELCKRGFADRMVLSHDCMCKFDWYPMDISAMMPDWNYCHIPKNVIPKLKEEGVSDADIDKMTIGNPARALCGI